MNNVREFISNLFITARFYLLASVPVLLFLISYFFPSLYFIAQISLLIIVLISLYEIILLYSTNGIESFRIVPNKLSNGDDNEISLHLENAYPLQIHLKIIDEVPAQFQYRDSYFEVTLDKGQNYWLNYSLRPTERGEYEFGITRLYASVFLRLIERRYNQGKPTISKVYPSIINMKEMALKAFSARRNQTGNKLIRRTGESMEFDQIRHYYIGDDRRKINWKATARKGELMVNQNIQEKAQPVYTLIDKGRLMKMPFNGLTLLDYSINAALALSNVSLKKDDKVGLLTFNNKIDSFIKADKKIKQLKLILENLYAQESGFLESDFSLLYAYVRKHISTRSLLMLYTNFETLDSLKRQLTYLRQMAKLHLLVVVFFENTELNRLAHTKTNTTEEVYNQIVAEKYLLEKKQIVKELKKYRINVVYAPPELISIESINKYLEKKMKNEI